MLGRCVSLKTLNLHHVFNLTDITTLGSCIALQTLDISNNSKLTDISVLARCTSGVEMISNFIGLRTLHVDETQANSCTDFQGILHVSPA